MKCAKCGSDQAYVGLAETECPAEVCENFSKAQFKHVYGYDHAPTPKQDPIWLWVQHHSDCGQ